MNFLSQSFMDQHPCIRSVADFFKYHEMELLIEEFRIVDAVKTQKGVMVYSDSPRFIENSDHEEFQEEVRTTSNICRSCSLELVTLVKKKQKKSFNVEDYLI